ncbi:MAG TPA: basic secretory protein-like protein [Polyangiaceae bacterium]|nr:basic secretory protein-like protein [Polyangiaceae bacterium]
MFHRSPRTSAALSLSILAACAACSAQDRSVSAQDSPSEELNHTTAPLSSAGPANLKAFVGGNDIALTWNAYPEFTVAYYRIFRDGREMGRAWPRRTHAVAFAGFADPSVERGITYSYQVQAVGTAGETSPLSSSVSATHPTNGFPVPAILIDDSAAPQLRPLLNKGADALRTWYPKIADLIAVGGYTPSKFLTLRAMVNRYPGEDSSVNHCGGAGWADGGDVLKICDYMANDDEGDMGLFVHEATHILQNYHSGAPKAVDEGIATWAGDLSQGIVRSLDFRNLSYMNGYEYSAAFYGWIQSHVSPSFVRNMNIRAHNAEFKYEWYKLETGQDVNQLWRAMTQVSLTMPFELRTFASLCAVPQDGKVKLEACRTEDQAKYFVYDPQLKRLYMNAHCLTVTNDGQVTDTTCGARKLDGSEQELPANAQSWTYTGTTWANVGTSQCLQPQGPTFLAGTPLVTAPCSSASKWSAPAAPLSSN